ncbi:carboxypeptidase [Acetobacter nitrogenifigens DSM 23921 = NBRC 105050]|uniref:Metal-dependent carboxypeptidase n=1 Tax=Acetobacter nitrogenifigens DSM 23921 = NBRC 105050 TaxID=1120919 RepID=A0A511X5L3_9PROT|nr:carboxypeptidase M32 [Acetobacter nitrogenifigens]GBQ98244.1 carboxypeptidase [Acetobacter nitrogenifigens DSM 23921 = NBRC 105050]GEN58210.1 carboxypeptidase M32 [Acetobacter nitrogenifigens DSM 23921 = NBRC 105050]
MTAYETLERLFARLSALGDAQGVLSWDRDVMMPDGAAERRGATMATLEGLRHELLTAPETQELLERADPGDDPWRAANLAEMRRLHTRAVAVPGDLVEALSKASSRCEMIWRGARANSDFAALLPDLQVVLDLTREGAVATGEALSLSPYDALLDAFDPGMRRDVIAPIFDKLGRELPSLLQAVLDRQSARSNAEAGPGRAPFPVAAQEAFGRTMMEAVGFDMTRGRLDVSTHPFCGGATDDVRITTRYDEANFLPAFLGVVHETGHALYEQGLPRAWTGQPVGTARGMTMHESQSLFLEMQIARSPAFASFAAPAMERAFGGEGWSSDALYRRMTNVEPGFIRVDADEVTYPAHIIARYELESAMVDGTLALRDLPEAFNARIKALLGLTVPDDRRGCLQDIHWPLGLWGYFPCYALGALTAAQLKEAATAALPDLDSSIRRGEFGDVVGWLRKAVHERASSASTMEIIADATGRPLGAGAYLRHIRERYLAD